MIIYFGVIDMKNKKKASNKFANQTIYKVQVIDKHTRFSKTVKILEFIIALVSMIIAITSLIISCNMQSEVNTFTENMSKLNYDLSIQETPEAISIDGEIITVSPFIIKKNKNMFSGNYSNIYIATVENQKIDLIEIKEETVKFFNNGSIIEAFGDFFDNGETFGFFYSPGHNNKWSILHIIIQAYNGEKSYYTLIYSCENKIVTSELFSNEDIYDRSKVEEFINKSSLDISVDTLIDKIEKERNLLKEKIS